MHAQRNPKGHTWQLPSGYADLGWQLSRDTPELVACREAKHERAEFDNSLYLYRCTDVISVCAHCKNVFHTDMSD